MEKKELSLNKKHSDFLKRQKSQKVLWAKLIHALRLYFKVIVTKFFVFSEIFKLIILIQYNYRHINFNDKLLLVKLKIRQKCNHLYIMTFLSPFSRTKPRYIPGVLKGIAMFPSRSTAITPPCPSISRSLSWIALLAAYSRLALVNYIMAEMS